MNMPEVPLLAMLRERMTWLHQRQDLLSQNVANADTPGYSARDLKPLDFDQLLKGSSGRGSAMVTTNPRHIAVGVSGAGHFEEHATPSASNPNGNAVSLEMEMIKVADTQAQFAAASNLYSKAMTLMRRAIS
jgi:flagellar basal-body rod protein FlgB